MMVFIWISPARNVGRKAFSWRPARKFGHVLKNTARSVRRRINPSRNEFGGHDERHRSLSDNELVAARLQFSGGPSRGSRHCQSHGAPGEVGVLGPLSTWVS